MRLGSFGGRFSGTPVTQPNSSATSRNQTSGPGRRSQAGDHDGEYQPKEACATILDGLVCTVPMSVQSHQA